MKTLTHKGYGRIYCETYDNVAMVREVIKELDEFEFGYLPKDLISVYSEYPKVVYIGKFSDLDMTALCATCWSRGIRIWVLDSGHNDFLMNAIKPVNADAEWPQVHSSD